MFDLDGKQRLIELARQGFFAGQEKIACHLHGDGRSAFLGAARQHITHCCTQHAQGIHTAVLIKTLVFCSQNRLGQHGRHRCQAHHGAAFLTKFGNQRMVGGVHPHRNFGAIVGQRIEAGQIRINQCSGQHDQHGDNQRKAEQERK